MENKSAVEWLTERLTIDWRDPWNRDLLQQAKQMEKEQIVNAWKDGNYARSLSKTKEPFNHASAYQTGREYYDELYESK